MMVLPILSGLVIIAIVWLVLWLFFPRIKGVLKLVVSLLVSLLLMRLFSSWFGLFSGFIDSARIWGVIGLSIGLGLLYGLITLQGIARRMLLFALALVGGFYVAILLVRMLGVGTAGDGGSDTDKTSYNTVTITTGSLSTGDNTDDVIIEITPGRGCGLPRGGGITDGSYTYAYDVRTDGVCDAQMRVCDDGVLYGSYTLPLCPDTRDGNVIYRDNYVYENEPDPVDPTIQPDYINLIPGVDGSQWYDLDGQRIDPGAELEVTGIVVEDPEPLWQVNMQPIYDCQTPWGERVRNGQFIKAYRYREGHADRSCEVQLRLCRNGELLGDFAYPSCVYRESSQG